MLFSTDRQTQEDLNIFSKKGEESLFTFFNHTNTSSGERLLTEFFNEPLSTVDSINKRSGIIFHFSIAGTVFPFADIQLNLVDSYLHDTDNRIQLSPLKTSLAQRVGSLIADNLDTTAIYNGITELIEVLSRINIFLDSLHMDEKHPFADEASAMRAILNDPELSIVIEGKNAKQLKRTDMHKLDELFRFKKKKDIIILFNYIVRLDVYCAIAMVARTHRLTFPQALAKSPLKLHLKDFYNLSVKDPVKNSLDIDDEQSIVFLTGANMAGKSTLMKALSTVLFLAHMGFPVPAERMEFSVLDGIYTTINLPDNLGSGASHFYSEVLRAKKIAQELQHRNLFVLFDELFRGTNVKDACEATVAIVEAFATRPESIFVLSTHILEAGETLQNTKGLQFLYLPTEILDGMPRYTYKLQHGITSDRHGMLIINNEGILDILNDGLLKLSAS